MEKICFVKLTQIRKTCARMSVNNAAQELGISKYFINKVLKNKVITPTRTQDEERLFNIYKKWLNADHIPKSVIIEYKNDLLKLSL